jgi:predicted kinase
MKIIKNYNDFLVEKAELNEGVYDPGILKAFFMAGGPGSGKSYVATEIFDFPKGAVSSVSYATGLKLVNNDNAFEKGLKDAGYSPSDLSKLAKDPEEWSKVMTIRDKAKNVTRRMQNNYIGGRLGQVIDGTGKNFDKIKGHRRLYQDLGYDTYMVFVNTSLEIALERNQMRERKLEDSMVEKMWRDVQDNLGKFQKLFGADRMLIVDNSEYGGNILQQIEKQVSKHLNKPIKNPLGKRWIQDQLIDKKRS